MMSIIGAVVLFIVVLSVLVLIHEAGHFIVARLFGVRVEEFGVGFPPRAWSVMRGETRYSVNWLPLGGFVKLKGEQGEDAQSTDSFAAKPIWQRVCILAAGVVMNLLLAGAIFIFSFTVGMPQVIDSAEDASRARDVSIHITQVLPGSPAEQAGIRAGDRILAIDGNALKTVEDTQKIIRTHDSVPLVLDIARGGQTISITATPKALSENENRVSLGIGLARVGTISYPFPVAIVKGVELTGAMIVLMVTTIVDAFRHLAFDGFVGPVGIAATTATVTKLGVPYLLNLIAQLSLSLAIFNVLPIPALDGGRIVFTVVECVRGRSIEPALENMIHLIGFAVLMTALLLVTFRDITRLVSV